MARRSELALILTVAVMASAATCDRVYVFKREALLSAWPDPACVESTLRSDPPLGDLSIWKPHPSSDDPRFTLQTFHVGTPDLPVSLWLRTDAEHKEMDISLHWSRLHHAPSRTEMAAITGLMDQIEERALKCPGVPQRASYRTRQNW